MTKKICFKCGIAKEVSEYYKHKGMVDGYLGKCKDCTKKDIRQREAALLENPDWVEKERERARNKYYRLEYKEKHKPTPEKRREAMKRYNEKYPEKKVAQSAASNIPSTNGQNHHWSYNKEHHKDVIDISPKEHAKVHRFIIYDQERMMYRRIDTMELLDTKEAHLNYINTIINKA